jgi:hypothetical protein
MEFATRRPIEFFLPFSFPIFFIVRSAGWEKKPPCATAHQKDRPTAASCALLWLGQNIQRFDCLFI